MRIVIYTIHGTGICTNIRLIFYGKLIGEYTLRSKNHVGKRYHTLGLVLLRCGFVIFYLVESWLSYPNLKDVCIFWGLEEQELCRLYLGYGPLAPGK